MDHVSMTWLMLYELRTDDREMHFSDFDPTEKITTEVSIRHKQLLIKSISEGDVNKQIPIN